MKTRKLHSDAWEADLTPQQQLDAFRMCQATDYGSAAEAIKNEFGLDRAPGLAAMNRFYHRMARQIQQSELERTLVDVANFKDLAAKLPDITAAKRAALEQAVINALVTKDHDRIKLLAELLLKERAADTEEKRTSLQVRKYEDALRAAKAALQDGSSAPRGPVTAETIRKIDEALLKPA